MQHLHKQKQKNKNQNNDIHTLHKISALQRAMKTSFLAPLWCKYKKLKIKKLKNNQSNVALMWH